MAGLSLGLGLGLSARGFGVPAPVLAWQKVHLGGLGYVTGIEIASDSSWMLAKTDVGGFYRRAVGETEWTQIVTSAGFPSSLRNPENYTAVAGNSFGSWDIAISRSDPEIAYAVFKAKLLKTTDSGVNWTETNFAIVGGSSNELPPNQQAFERLQTYKMVVDPQDPDTVLLWSPKTGAYRTIDGGANWTQPTGLPTISGQAAGDRIGLLACDEGSTVGSGRIWFAHGFGAGLYRSTDNGATWSNAGTGYDTYTQASDLVYRSSGVMWLVDRSSGATQDNIRIWTQGSGWTSITSTPNSFKVRYVSINPANPNDILASAGGSSGMFTRSVDGGATWTAAWNGTTQMRSQHVETRAISYVQDQDGAGNFSWVFTKPVYHPTEDYLYWPTGYGVCRNDYTASAFTTPNGSDRVVIEDFCAGLEELVAVFGLILPDASLVLISQDKPAMKITDPLTYALPAFPGGVGLNNGYYADWVEGDPSKIGFALGGNLDGYSDDGGATRTTFTTQPVTSIGGGSIVRFDDQRFVRFLGQNRRPRYTTDKGATWNVPTFTGGTLPADGSTNGFGTGLIDFTHRMVTKNRAVPGEAFCVNFGEGGSNTMRGCWKSTDYGATWANQTNSLILTSGTQNGHATVLHMDGVLYYTAGSTGSGYTQETTNNYLFRSTDDGVNWTAIRTSTGFAQEVTEALHIGWGAEAEGSSYKTIWMYGWVDHVLGIYYSADRGLTWTAFETPPLFANSAFIAGDPTTFGRVMIGEAGVGYWLRTASS